MLRELVSSVSGRDAVAREEDVKVPHRCTGFAAVVSTTLLTACGTGSPAASTLLPSSVASTASAAPTSVASPPAETTLVKQMNSALASARSVHVAVPVQPGSDNTALDISLTRSNDMYGYMTYKGQHIIVLVRNGRAYMKLTAGAVKVLGLSSSVCVLMCGKVLEMTASESQSMFSGVRWSTLAPTPGSVPQLHYVRTTIVDGQPAWELSARGGNTVYLAAQGKPYPLRVVQGQNHIDYT